jgi:ketosteroid isomerase-like protein
MTTTDTDLSSPEALMRTFSACLNVGDLDGLVALYEPDAVFEPQPGVVVHGRAAVRDALDQLLALGPTITA